MIKTTRTRTEGEREKAISGVSSKEAKKAKRHIQKKEISAENGKSEPNAIKRAKDWAKGVSSCRQGFPRGAEGQGKGRAQRVKRRCVETEQGCRMERKKGYAERESSC